MSTPSEPEGGRPDPGLDVIMSERRQLINLAYRLLGSLAEAEDAAQETYARWYAMPEQQREVIASPGAWLTTVASRICLDVLGSARARRERYVGEWIPEPLPEPAEWVSGRPGATTGDPADRITLDESVSMAFLVVLESMTPAERVAFVLDNGGATAGQGIARPSSVWFGRGPLPAGVALGGVAMVPNETGTLDEAYQRLHATGPEFDGWLSNHGPMAAEAMVRRGHAGQVHRWLDLYMQRLEEFPRGSGPIGTDWREALGDPRRIADWTVYFRREVAGQPWRQALETWWPRLLPGVAAAATHGVIRVGHAVRALTQDGEDADHLAELAHGLAYWAARWQPVPGVPAAGLPQTTVRIADGEPAAAADALAAVPRIADQSGGIRDRLARLAELPGWPGALAAPQIPASAEALPPWLASLVDAAVLRYLRYGHGEGVMLVHSATAPNAILRTLPVLDRRLWAPSVAASWAATAALTAIYGPAGAAPQAELPDPPAGAQPAEETFARAVEHGDEHVIKFADTATDVYTRTGNTGALAAAIRATYLIDR